MSPASQRLSMGQLWRWSIVASWCLSTLAVAQQPGIPKPAPLKAAPKPAQKPPTPEELAMNAERARVKAVEAALTKAGTKISQVFRSGQVGEGDRAEVDQYFVNYIDILTSPAGPLEMPDARQKLRQMVRNFGNPSNPMEKSGLVYVNNLLLTKLKEAAWSDKFPPHGRFNCMLSLGDLNEAEPNLVGAGTVKAMPQALPVLLDAVKQPDMLAAVKVAALTGIQRHARLGIADKNVEREVVLELAKLVAQATPPRDDDSAAGHHWMRRQAIDVLTSLKQPGPQNEAAIALAAAVTDKNNPMWVRLDAVRALGQLKVPAEAMGEEGTPILGNLTLDLMKNETSHRAWRLGFQSLLIGLRGQDAGSGLIASLAGEDKKRGAELGQKLNIYSQLVGGNPDPTLLFPLMQTETAALEVWLLGEDPNAPAAP